MPRPPHYRPIITEGDALQALPRIIPRTKPTPIPAPSIFDEPTYCFKINKDWAGHFLGAILISLNQPDTWKADETHDVEWARLQVIEWVAKLLTEDQCMPCCDDLVEQITELVSINNTMLTNIVTIVTNLTTVINNQTTQIDNSETIIEQNLQQTYNQLVTNYNQQLNINQEYTTLNQMLYDGTPESIAPNIGTNWNDSGDGALCAAVKRYVEKAIYDRTNEINIDYAAESAVINAIVVAMAAAAGLTVGASAAIGAVIAGANLAAGLALSAWNASVNDPNARLKVICCMYDHLKDQPVTPETFKASVNDCSFDVGTNESNIAALIDGANQIDDNYLAFLRAMTGAPASDDSECQCCDVQLVADNDCVVTALGDCRWRIVQTHGEIGGGDPFCTDGYKYYTAAFKDQFDRCINIVSASGTATSNWTQIDCADVEHSGVGGGGGEGKHFVWVSKACPPDETYLDIIVEAILVE